MSEAFVTLVTNDEYVHPARVLAHSLRRAGTTRPVVVVYTDDVSEAKKRELKEVFDHTVRVEAFDSGDVKNLALLGRPELGITFTKLRVWSLVDYTKCVFLDADTVVLQSIDELFQREEFSASPDVGWPDMFNSGVFVFQPSLVTYQSLLAAAASIGSFDGGDQGLLNDFFQSWTRLSFVFNMTINASYGYAPAYVRFKHAVKIVHFAGVLKPWRGIPNPTTGEGVMELYAKWWSLSDSLNTSLSQSASYKTIMSGKRSKSPGILMPSPAPPPEVTASFASPHDVRRPLGDFTKSSSSEEILSLIRGHIEGAAVRSPTSEAAHIASLSSAFKTLSHHEIAEAVKAEAVKAEAAHSETVGKSAKDEAKPVTEKSHVPKKQ